MHCQGVSPQPLRPYSMHWAIIWRGEGFQHFSDISRFLTFMVKSPQTCLSSNPQCADMQVYELHTYTDSCQRCGLVLNDCKHTPVWNDVLLSTIWQMVHRAKSAASPGMQFLFYGPSAFTVNFCFCQKQLDLQKNRTLYSLLYVWSD